MKRRGQSLYILILEPKYSFVAEILRNRFVLGSNKQPVHSYVGSPTGLPEHIVDTRYITHFSSNGQAILFT